MRRLAIIAILIAAAAASLATRAVGEDSHTYFIEMDNAFGLVTASEVKVAGITQGQIEEFFVNSRKKAVAKVTTSGEVAELGTETTCSTEPQSLIAEYFIDCDPAGPPITEGEGTDGSDAERSENPDISADQVFQTVQNDLAQSALREPFKRRLQLILNEFGIALAGNPEELNAAIRRGAPALRELRKVLDVLGDQNRIIRRLNVDSDRIMAALENRKRDVVRFVRNAEATASASAERRDDLSTDFELLDDFLAELQPTLAGVRRLATEQTPLLRDLRAAAPGLNTLATNLPDFNDASTEALVSLGEAGRVGRRALRKGEDELRLLQRAVRKAPTTGEFLADLLRDLDDPGRAIEVDERAARDTGRDFPTGYTGLEGLLNYVYYQPGAVNQFDEVSHLLHFSIFEIEAGPCHGWNAGGEPGTPEFGVPAEGGGHTTDIRDAARCVSWLGDSQPDLNDPLNLPKYHPDVCPDGSDSPELCDPSDPASAPASAAGGDGRPGTRGRSGDDGATGRGGGGGSPGVPDIDDLPRGGPKLPGGLDDLLDLPRITDGVKLSGPAAKRATGDLISFLLEN